MANIDEFIATHRSEGTLKTPVTEWTLDQIGGYAYIFNSDGNFKMLGFGRITALTEIYDTPDLDQNWTRFQSLLDDRPLDNLFNNHFAFVSLVQAEVIDMYPDTTTKQLVEQKVGVLQSTFKEYDGSLRANDRDPGVVRGLSKIVGADSPEEMMQQIVLYDGSIYHLVHVPLVFQGRLDRGNDSREKYESAQSAYEDLITTCKGGVYTFKISERAKNSRWVSCIDMFSVSDKKLPDRETRVFLADTPEEVNLIADRDFGHFTLVYRGKSNSSATDALKRFDQNDKVRIISENVKTVGQYLDHVTQG